MTPTARLLRMVTTAALLWLLASAVTLVACGGGGGGGRRPPVPPAPSPSPVELPRFVLPPDQITAEIAFWPPGVIWNPEPWRAFNVEVSGGLDLTRTLDLLGGVVRATDARVGFVHEPGRPFDFHVVLDAEHPAIQNPDGPRYAAVGTFWGTAGRITEGLIIVSSRRWGTAERVMSHEGGHAALGLWHASPEACTTCMMGGDIPLETLEFSPAEIASIRWKLAQRDGSRRAGPDAGKASVSSTPESFMCRLEVRR